MPRSLRSAARPGGLGLLAALALAACGGAAPPSPPGPGWTSGPAVRLDGARVLVLPAQGVRGVPGDVDAELAFGLETRGARVAWIGPAELRRALERSPGLRANPDALPVGVFLQAEVRRIGDPLYGELRRMGALTDATAAFLPVAVRARAATDSVPAGVEIVAALVDVRSGGVIWSGVVEGIGEPGSPGTLAAAVDALAVAMLGSTDERRVETATPEAPARDGVEIDGTQHPDGGADAPRRRPHDGPRGLRAGRAADAHGAGGGGVLHVLR